jgi:hypothetical protein
LRRSRDKKEFIGVFKEKKYKQVTAPKALRRTWMPSVKVSVLIP